jgi:hypothetical protein
MSSLLPQEGYHMTVRSSDLVSGLPAQQGKKITTIVLFLAMLLVLVSTTAAGPRPLVAVMTGGQEVPGPGDADGFGIALVRLNQSRGQVCFAIAVFNITLPATAAHIHPGERGVANPPIVTFTAPDESGTSKGCVSGVDPALIADIRANPSNYYVNVHNADFQPGAVRGQLK